MHALALLLTACGGASSPLAAEVVPPPGQTMTLTGPAAIVAGEEVTVEVTSAAMQPGDRVDLIVGDRQGAGPCPMRQITGGSPCLDVAGSVAHRASTLAEVDALAPTGVAARFVLPLAALTETVWLQAFRAAGATSETSNPWEVAVAQPWPELEPRVTDAEAEIAALQTSVADLATVVDGLASVSGMAMVYVEANDGTPSVVSQTSPFVQSLVDYGGGVVGVNFAAGWSGQTPYCVCTSQHFPSVQHMACNIHLPAGGGFQVATAGVDGVGRDRDFWMLCMPR